MVDLKPEETVQNAAAVPLLQRVIADVRPFMGLQAEQFVRRQCAHIKVSPENLTRENLELLAWWMKNSARLIMDRQKAEQLFEKIMGLAAK
jgi:hypothetical protein